VTSDRPGDTMAVGVRMNHDNKLSATTGPGLSLATRGATTSPLFFSGFVERPDVVAASLLVVARVARSRFYVPPGSLVRSGHDPVVTSTPEGLRFEAFSSCGGVYARLDVLESWIDAELVTVGVTNVDVNAPLRAALASIVSGDPLRITVGPDELTVQTLDAQVVEERVPLSDRWLRGFAETQVAASAMSRLAEFDANSTARFLRSIPTTTPTNTAMWVAAGAAPRLGSSPSPGAVCIGGPDRLGLVAPLLRFSPTLVAYGTADATTAVSGMWVFSLPGARLTIGLSSQKSRAFSGEGAVLDALAVADATTDATLVGTLLSFDSAIDLDRLVAQSGLLIERVRTALTALAMSGQVGFDLSAGSHFHRPLPYDLALIDGLNPRLQKARSLKAHNAGDHWVVASRDVHHRVVLSAKGDRCSCPWYGTHRGNRGPCAHVLAARLARD